MKFATVCSGIGAPEVAAESLGWECAFSSEIEPFPNAVRAHHWPHVPNYGDMTKYHEWKKHTIDVLIGGTPCQAFSVAGLRKGLADPRGNLTLTFLGIVDRYRPQWVLWENVPGVLSDKTGAFGALLGGLGQLGYGFAYRVLDAQYFGVAQRRRRVFVVGHSGGQWQRAAAVLFNRESLRGDSAPRRQSGKGTAPTISARTKGGGGLGAAAECDGAVIPIQECGKRTGTSTTDVRCGIGIGEKNDPMFTLQSGANHGVAQPIGIDGSDVGFALRANASHSGDKGDGGVNTNMVVHSLPEVCGCLSDGAHMGGGLTDRTPTPDASFPQVAWALQERDAKGADSSTKEGHLIPTPQRGFFNGPDSEIKMAVRRLTPKECERLQGFPDNFTMINFRNKPTADGPRYKALGNSMAVPNIRWILQRMEMVNKL